jgi:pimeloyl-ACP methyl ester carboxylesterase
MVTDSKALHLDVLGAQTRVWQYGNSDGAPILLVHGFRGDHHGLAGIAEALVVRAPELNVWVPDLPGFGESQALPNRQHNLQAYGQWLCSLVQAAGYAPSGFAVLGHSFGSLVVANAIFQGLQPSSTTLINPISSPALQGPQAVMTQLAVLYYRVAAMLPENASRALLGNRGIVRLMSEVMAKTRDAELRAWIHDQHHRYFSRFSDSTTLLEAFEASVSHTVAEYSAAFDTRTLLIAGDRDDITPLAEQLALSRKISHATLRVVPGVGHLVHYEAVADAADEIVRFLRTGEQA